MFSLMRQSPYYPMRHSLGKQGERRSCRERSRERTFLMSDHVYKKIELVGSSPESIEAAVKNALERAGKTVRNMRWFEVTETRGHIVDGKVDHWQVTVKIGFTLEG